MDDGGEAPARVDKLVDVLDGLPTQLGMLDDMGHHAAAKLSQAPDVLEADVAGLQAELTNSGDGG